MSIFTTTSSEHAKTNQKISTSPHWTTVVGVVVVDVASCFVSWRIVQPGNSLFGPTSLAIAVMGLTAVAWHFACRKRLSPRVQRTLWPIIVLLCLLPPWWAYFGVLQFSLRLDSSVTRTAQELIASKSAACNIVTTGSVGLLRAPYEVCATDMPGYGYRVNFSTLDGGRGYAYIQGRTNVSWFPNQCAQHLFGDWWAFNVSVNTATTSCPMGYPENGSG